MQVSLSWLRSLCNPAMSDLALQELLTMGGFEVEQAVSAAPSFSLVKVAEVLSVTPHPDADRLRVCQVDVGAGETAQIVCGAPNVRVGLKVPCALPGAVLPAKAGSTEPLRIQTGRLRGVESQGMLCSAHELGVDHDSAGLWELPPGLTTGQDIRLALDLDDTILTLKLTPNLGHALSVQGLAREVAALAQTPLLDLPKLPPFSVQPQIGPGPAIQVQDAQLCGRWVGRVIRGITMQTPSPDWLVQRLARMGQRSVNILVDISNYIMFECGQPTHIYDLDKLHGDLTVRWAQAGERLTLLNGQAITLEGQTGVIADDNGPQSLAGIMGGQASAVSDSTRNIYIEGAFWWPQAVAGVARRYQLHSDAVHRFERGVDPHLTTCAVERVSALVMSLCGSAAQAGPLRELQLAVPEAKTLSLRASRVARVSGLTLDLAACLQVLTPLAQLGFTVAKHDADTLHIGVPPWRFDITLEEDLVEEVVRLYGYDRLPDTAPLAPLAACASSDTRRSRYSVSRHMVQLGYTECLHFSFVDEAWEKALTRNDAPIRLLNPIAQHLSVMRSTLLGGLLQALRYNTDRQQTRVRLFECARVFERQPEAKAAAQQIHGIHQTWMLAALAYGPSQPVHWRETKHSDKLGSDYYSMRGDLESLFGLRTAEALQFVPCTPEHPALHPGRSADVLLAGQVIGVIGELHPQVCSVFDLGQAPMVFELRLDALLHQAAVEQKDIPKALPIERDIALLVPLDTPYSRIEEVLLGPERHPLLQRLAVFDVYIPHTDDVQDRHFEKSVALRLQVGDKEKTLKDKEIDEVVGFCIEKLKQHTGAKWRK